MYYQQYVESERRVESRRDVPLAELLGEFWRGCFGRRSENQLRGWVRAGDADAFAKTLPVFPARSTDLLESA